MEYQDRYWMYYTISTDTGLSGVVATAKNLLEAPQDILQEFLTKYGKWIEEIGEELASDWDEKLANANIFSASLRETKN